MTSFSSESDVNLSSGKSEQLTDIESYRKLVLNLLSLRRYKSALFWAEKVVVLSNPRDVYQLAHCMFMLKEYNRAAHLLKSSGLEKTNLLCLALMIECLYASTDFQEALNLLTTLEIEDLNTSLHTDAEVESLMGQTNEPSKNVSERVEEF